MSNFIIKGLLDKKFEGFQSGEIGAFHSTQIWVRAFNILAEEMISEVGMMVGDNIGVAIKVDSDYQGRCLGTVYEGAGLDQCY